MAPARAPRLPRVSRSPACPRLAPAEVGPEVHFANYHKVRPGTVWGPRTIPDLELILAVAGEFMLETSEGDFPQHPGEVVLIYPETHVYRCLPDSGPAIISCIHCELLPGKSWAAGEYRFAEAVPRITPATSDPAVHEAFRRCAELMADYGAWRDELLSATAREVWLRLARLRAGGGARPAPRLEAMLSFLRSNLMQPVTRRDLAEAFYLTPEHVNALFRRELRLTPGQYVRRERVLLACRLMQQEGLSVKEAAARVGYDDPFYFSRVFRSVLGSPPAAFTRSGRGA